MDIHIYSHTNKGAGPINEDFCGYWQEDGKGVFVVADGLGGHGHGDTASQLAVRCILNAVKNDFSIEDSYLLTLISGANQELIDHQRAYPETQSMRTTIAAGLILEDTFRYFNVGDSRIYYFKSGRLYTQSKDHSVSQMAVDLGEITPDEIRFHDDRAKLLKVLGDTESLSLVKLAPRIKMEAGDAILLCSDGFWEYVFETEMELDLAKSDTPEEWCGFMCRRLLRRVTGNNDNFTAVAIQICNPSNQVRRV